MNAVVREIADSLGAVKVLLLQQDLDGAMEILNRYKLIFPDGAPSIAMPPPAGHWTTQAPTKPGWYWFEENGIKVVTEVRICVENHLGIGIRSYLVATYRGKTMFPVIKMDGEWHSEPLSVPGPNGE